MITDYTNYSGYTNNNLGYIKKNSSFSSSKENPFKKANEELLALKNKAFKKTSESVLCNNSEINQFPKVPEYIKNNRDLYLGWLGDISHDPKYSKEVRDTALNKFNDLAKKNTQAENSIINSANDWINAANEGERNTIVGCTTAIATVIGLYAAAPAIASLGPFLSAAAKEALSTCNNVQIGLSQSGQPMLAPAGGGTLGGGGSIVLNDAMIKSLVTAGIITVAIAQKLSPLMRNNNSSEGTGTNTQNNINTIDPKKPPTHPDYEAPKNWNGQKVKNPNGKGSGWPDKKGRVWMPTNHDNTHNWHWDVQSPGGKYINIYP